MQPFSAELSRARLLEQKADIAIGPDRYRADPRHGVVVETGPAGEKRYPILHAMGGKNVFYFLTLLERGRLQVLPIAYDVRRQEWFDMSASAVRHLGTTPDTPLNWRDAPFTFNTACFSCHVSQLSKNYDLRTDRYHTVWAELGINCETCHGPGAEHIRAARAVPNGASLRELKLVATSAFEPEQMNALCGSCHAKMFPITGAFAPGDAFFDHFGLVTLEDADFYADGRDLGENFTYTSWRMSPCLKSGRLSCTHCHTSSGRNRFEGRDANRACLPCHEELVKHSAEHSHHQPGTDGAKCVACHMPVTEFARMRRSDHSMRPPAPAASLVTGSPNACNVCHTNKDAAWSDQWVRKWQPRDYQAPLLERTELMTAARQRDWSKLPRIVGYLSSLNHEEVWAASLLRLLRLCDEPGKWEGIKPCLRDPSPLVRAAAVDASSDQLTPDIVAPLVAATRDRFRLVRIRAASALAAVPREWFDEKDKTALAAATGELEDSFMAHPDDATAHYNLGNYHLERREFGPAIEAFQTATRLQPRSIPPLVNASLAFSAVGQNGKAEASLRSALRVDPTNAVANLNFGMLLAELGRRPEAEKAFRTAASSDPQSAAAAYNLGVLLAPEHPEEALTWSRRAVTLRPSEPKYSYTLGYFLAQQGKRDEAIAVLAKATETGSPSPDSIALLGELYESRRDWSEALAIYRTAAADERLPAAVRQQFAIKAQQIAPDSGGGSPR
jgi:tetratricopeptide (TPR) repeat protein